MIRIAIGTEPQQWVPTLVLMHSIERRTEHPAKFELSWTPERRWHKLFQHVPGIPNGTAFSLWRWIVQRAFMHERKLIYLDADQVCLTDISDLWNVIDDDKAMAAVTEARGFFGDKKKPEPGKTQTSVMVTRPGFGVYAKLGDLINRVAERSYAYRDLMQATWMPRELVQSINPAWNHFSVHDPTTKILHYSHVKSQPYRNPGHPTAYVFGDELRDAIQQKVIDPKIVKREVERKHLDREWLKCIK